MDVCVKRGDVGSDHQLLVSKLRFNLKSKKKGNIVVCMYDTDLFRRDGEEGEDFKWV